LEPDARGGARGRLFLRAGERHWLVVTADPGTDVSPETCEHQLSTTLQLWQQWASKCTYEGPYRDLVLRSALVLAEELDPKSGEQLGNFPRASVTSA